MLRGHYGADRSASPRAGLRQMTPPPPPPKRHPYDQWAPDARALDLIGDKWTLLIIRDLAARPAALRRAAARPAGHLDRAAALAAESHGRRRPAHAPALPRGAAARRLRADPALIRAARRARRADPLGPALDLEPAARGRGDRHRGDPARRPGLDQTRPRARGHRRAARDARRRDDRALRHHDRGGHGDDRRAPGARRRGTHRRQRGRLDRRARARRASAAACASAATSDWPRRCSTASSPTPGHGVRAA